jgi:hypothetical protein
MAQDNTYSSIKDLAFGIRKASPSDGDVVRRHVSKASFNPTVRPHRVWARLGLSVIGSLHPSRSSETIADETHLSSLEFHVAKRIKLGHWASSTTPSSYEKDCQRAAGKAYLVKAGRAQQRPDEPLVVTQTRVTKEFFPDVQATSGELMIVVFDASKNWISSGYCVQEAKASGTVYARWVRSPAPQVLPLPSEET